MYYLRKFTIMFTFPHILLWKSLKRIETKTLPVKRQVAMMVAGLAKTGGCIHYTRHCFRQTVKSSQTKISKTKKIIITRLPTSQGAVKMNPVCKKTLGIKVSIFSAPLQTVHPPLYISIKHHTLHKSLREKVQHLHSCCKEQKNQQVSLKAAHDWSAQFTWPFIADMPSVKKKLLKPFRPFKSNVETGAL